MKKIISILTASVLFSSANADDFLTSIGVGHQNMQLIATRTPIAIDANVVLTLPSNITFSAFAFSVLDRDQNEIDYRISYHWMEHSFSIGVNDFGTVGNFSKRADIFSYKFDIKNVFAFGGMYGKPKNGKDGYFVYSNLGLFENIYAGVNIGQEMFTKKEYQTIYLQHRDIIGGNMEIINKLACQNKGTNDGCFATFNLNYHF